MRAVEVQHESMIRAIASALAAGIPDDQVERWVCARVHDVNLEASARWADWFIEHGQGPLDSESESHDEEIEDVIQSYWGEALTFFYLAVFQSCEIAQWHADQVEGAEGADDVCYLVQRGLQARACRTGFEVHYLLSGGFPSAAAARARTLYELAVVALVITGSPDPQTTARRFQEHAACEDLREKRALYEVLPVLDDAERARVQELEATVDRLVDKYGRDYGRDWGWASHLFSARPTFSALESLAGREEDRPAYRRLCHAVHAGTIGTNDVIEWMPGGHVFAVRQSDQLSSIPPVVALSSLAECTRALLRTHTEGSSDNAFFWAAGIEELMNRSLEEFSRRSKFMDSERIRWQALEGDS